MKTYNDVYLTARRKLRAMGITAHDMEARLIVAYAAGKTKEELIKSGRLYISDSSLIDTVDEIIKRRLQGEPIAYIVGEWEFFGLPIAVNDSVIIPRTDTEVLVEHAIRFLKYHRVESRVLDLCTGSGCVGLAIAANVPSCRIVLVDNSERALSLCRTNMLKNRLTRNVTAIEADVKEPPPSLLGLFDMIVSNPPYIPRDDINSLDHSVSSYEPIKALDGGHDGLDFFRAISESWKTTLKDNGILMFECGIGQALDVREIMMNSGFKDIRVIPDLEGIDRVVAGNLGD